MVKCQQFSTRKKEGPTMHIKGFLHKMLCDVMHSKRLSTLVLLTETVLKNKKLSLTELGRGLSLPIQERSGIRRADRFLGNKKLYEEIKMIYGRVAHCAVGSRQRPDIIVDWSHIPNTTHYLLRAALVAEGRAITLYEEVHQEKKLGNKETQNHFLHHLKGLLGEGCRPLILTDAGFHNDWFKAVVELKWDYIGRIRGKKYYKRMGEESWRKCSESVFCCRNHPEISGQSRVVPLEYIGHTVMSLQRKRARKADDE